MCSGPIFYSCYFQQVQAAHNQLKSLKQFLEGQTAEREHERLEFDRQIEQLEELLKEKERDYMSKYGSEVHFSGHLSHFWPTNVN